MGEKGKKRTRFLAYMALYTALMAICAWICIPFAVPVTMQLFAVLFAAGILGGRRAALAVVLYLVLGLTGLPVFSGFTGGAGILVGPAGGYLMGFIFAALVAGGTMRLFGRSFGGLCAAMALGTAVCYVFGTVWFVMIYARGGGNMGLMAVLAECVIPFLLPDAAKIVLAAWMTKRFSKVIKL